MTTRGSPGLAQGGTWMLVSRPRMRRLGRLRKAGRSSARCHALRPACAPGRGPRRRGGSLVVPFSPATCRFQHACEACLLLLLGQDAARTAASICGATTLRAARLSRGPPIRCKGALSETGSWPVGAFAARGAVRRARRDERSAGTRIHAAHRGANAPWSLERRKHGKGRGVQEGQQRASGR